MPDARNRVLVSLGFAILAVGCAQEGPAERAGKHVDQAVERAGEKLDAAAEKVGEAAEKAGDKVREKTN